MRRHAARHDRREAGFTLLEMIVVLVIVGLAAAIVGARTGNVTPQVQLRSAVQKFAAELRIARAEALRTGATRIVMVDPATRTYWIGDAKQPSALPPAVVMRAAASDLSTEDKGPREGSGPLRIVFAPDGSSSGGVISLAAGGGGATVTVDWLTGATRIAWGR